MASLPSQMANMLLSWKRSIHEFLRCINQTSILNVHDSQIVRVGLDVRFRGSVERRGSSAGL